MSEGEETFALHCKAYKLSPLREYKFHPVRLWRFDFAFVDHMLAVEIEGGIWTAGRHTTGTGFLHDIEKYNAATELGWRLLRFSTQAVMKGNAIEVTKRVLAELPSTEK